jgi:hypothetical protein
VHWVTPITAAYARPLIEGLRNEVVVTNQRAADLFPDIQPAGYLESVRHALDQLHPAYVTAPAVMAEDRDRPTGLTTIDKGMILEVRRQSVHARPEAVYEAFTRIGGPNGWPCNWAWRARAALDRIAGGPGMRRSLPLAGDIQEGDTINFFRVGAVKRGRMIRLKAEMKLPGDGWLQFEAEPVEEGHARLTQTVFFAPRGLLGIIYWYLVLPAHKLIFARMIAQLAARAEGH